jgi:hypothetical protein
VWEQRPQMEDALPAPPTQQCRRPCRRLFGGRRWRCSKPPRREPTPLSSRAVDMTSGPPHREHRLQYLHHRRPPPLKMTYPKSHPPPRMEGRTLKSSGWGGEAHRVRRVPPGNILSPGEPITATFLPCGREGSQRPHPGARSPSPTSRRRGPLGTMRRGRGGRTGAAAG